MREFLSLFVVLLGFFSFGAGIRLVKSYFGTEVWGKIGNIQLLLMFVCVILLLLSAYIKGDGVGHNPYLFVLCMFIGITVGYIRGHNIERLIKMIKFFDY